MVKFIGEYTVRIDDKGRVVFPSPLKAQLQGGLVKNGSDQEGNGPDLRFVIKKALWGACLEMYTFAEWERQSEEINATLNPLKEKDVIFWRAYTRGRAIVEPDGKLGRISIPKTLLESIGAGKELVFCGSDHKIEIWSKEQFDKSTLTNEEFISLTESLFEK